MSKQFRDEYSLYGDSYGWLDDEAAEATLNRFGFGRDLVRRDKDEPSDPPKDEQGNVLTVEAVLEALDALEASRLDIDSMARERSSDDLEEQATYCKALEAQYTKKERKLKDALRAIQKYEDEQAARRGFYDFGLGDDKEGNQKVEQLLEENVEWFEDEVHALKERLAERVRKGLEAIEADGHEVTDEVRDEVYHALVTEEVIEEWEPLLF